MDKKRLIHKVNEIALEIKENYQKLEPPGVLVGGSGLALFCFYYADFFDDDDFATLGSEILENTFSNVNKGLNYSTYCLGLAGAGWALEHLKEKNFIDLNTDDFLKDLDSSLFEIMSENITNGNYDFLHGALGYGFYFLKRWKRTQDKGLRKKYHEYLSFLVTRLKFISEKCANGIRWSSDLRKEDGQQVYNLGLSHGIASIINFLSRLEDIEKETTLELLHGATNYLLSTQSNDYDSISLFQNWIPRNGEKPIKTTRLAWCYGDLGIGISLRKAALKLKDAQLIEKSNQILEHSANRKDDAQTKVVDAGICHGSFGNAQIFNRLYQETRNKSFKETAGFWIESGLRKATFPNGYAGFKQYNGKKDNWESELHILEGVAGIGLSILSFLSDDNSWDECLMIGN